MVLTRFWRSVNYRDRVFRASNSAAPAQDGSRCGIFRLAGGKTGAEKGPGERLCRIDFRRAAGRSIRAHRIGKRLFVGVAKTDRFDACLGVGDPQVWNDSSVDRFPAFIVASYSFLLLASLEAYGAKRTNEYLQPPKWQRRRTRPSCLDLLALLRKEAIENPELLKSADLSFEPVEACLKAVA